MEKHQLTQQIFNLVRGLLEQKRLLLKSGTIVDATIIEAPPSTKNQDQARDPEMRQTKKGVLHFGMKAHVGTDLNGLVHTLVTTHAAPSGFQELLRRMCSVKPGVQVPLTWNSVITSYASAPRRCQRLR